MFLCWFPGVQCPTIRRSLAGEAPALLLHYEYVEAATVEEEIVVVVVVGRDTRECPVNYSSTTTYQESHTSRSLAEVAWQGCAKTKDWEDVQLGRTV